MVAASIGAATSDLDLVLRSPDLSPIDVEKLNALDQALKESNIPIIIEARDWTRLPDSFHREIERNLCGAETSKTKNHFLKAQFFIKITRIPKCLP